MPAFGRVEGERGNELLSLPLSFSFSIALSPVVRNAEMTAGEGGEESERTNLLLLPQRRENCTKIGIEEYEIFSYEREADCVPLRALSLRSSDDVGETDLC